MDKQIIKTIVTEKQNAVTKYSVIKRNFDFDLSANYVLVGFDEQVAVTAANNGVSVARVAKYPGAFAADSEETLIANTRNILWPQMIHQ